MTIVRAFEFSGRIRSFAHAGRGVAVMLASQHNAWIHATATVLVVVAGFALRISAASWCLLTLAAASIWVAEATKSMIWINQLRLSPTQPRVAQPHR